MEALSAEKTVRRFSSHEEQKAETTRYWNSLSPGERLLAVWDATQTGYALTGVNYDATRRY
jgi:hypothetical protein